MNFETSSVSPAEKDKQTKKITGARVGAVMLAGIAATEASAQDTEPVTNAQGVVVETITTEQQQERYLEGMRTQIEREVQEKYKEILAQLRADIENDVTWNEKQQETASASGPEEGLRQMEEIMNREIAGRMEMQERIFYVVDTLDRASALMSDMSEATDGLRNVTGEMQGQESAERQEYSKELTPVMRDHLKRVDEDIEDIRALML